MFDDLLNTHRIFVNTAEHDIVEYERIEKKALDASKDSLVHLYHFELNEDCEVESDVDVWMYHEYTFGEQDDNVFGVYKGNRLYVETDSLESCIQFIVRND